jgi:DNA-binding NtrC family response regulator
MATILVVDDEVGIRELLSEILADEGHTVRLAQDATAAREARGRERPDLVLLDIWMPDTDGISLLKEWAAGGQLTMPVVMMSGHATIDTAVEATRIGALDFLEKPIAMQKLLATVRRALRAPEAPLAAGLALANLGRSAAIADLRKRLAQLGQASASLLLRGEPGVMPELFARALAPPGTPWAAAGAALADSPQELLAQATGGILFVAELASLGRVPQRNLAFVAARAERQKLRLVSFTAEDPRRLVDELGFDGGLLAQLSQVVLALPALREYAEDVPEIASMLLAQLVEARFCPPREFSTAALNSLRNYAWPGNLEALQQVVRSAALTALEDSISAEDVQRCLPTAEAPAAFAGLPLDLPLREAREAFERAYFEHHLAREGSMTRLAERSGLERTHLYRKLRQLGLGPAKKED